MKIFYGKLSTVQCPGFSLQGPSFNKKGTFEFPERPGKEQFQVSFGLPQNIALLSGVSIYPIFRYVTILSYRRRHWTDDVADFKVHAIAIVVATLIHSKSSRKVPLHFTGSETTKRSSNVPRIHQEDLQCLEILC